MKNILTQVKMKMTLSSEQSPSPWSDGFCVRGSRFKSSAVSSPLLFQMSLPLEKEKNMAFSEGAEERKLTP